MARLGGRWWVWAEKCRIIQGGENLRAHLPAQGMVTLNSDAFSQGVLKTLRMGIPQPLWATRSSA